jgi:hypothetical protein
MACGPSAGRADLVGLVRHVPLGADESGKHQPPCPVLHRVNIGSTRRAGLRCLIIRLIIQTIRAAAHRMLDGRTGVLAQRSQRITR